jgi:hypothetical protein
MTDLQIEKIRQQVARKYEIDADDLSNKSALSDTVRLARGEIGVRRRARRRAAHPCWKDASSTSLPPPGRPSARRANLAPAPFCFVR